MSNQVAYNILSFMDSRGQNFDFLHANHKYSFTLQEVVALPKHNENNSEPFSLIFELKSSFDQYFEQGLFELESKKLGTLKIFLVPIGPNKSSGQMQYEAIFN